MKNDSIKLQISRNSEIRDTRGVAVLSLDLVDHFPGQLVMTSYYTNPEKNEIDTLFAIGVGTGKGRENYRVLATGKQNILWDVVDTIPDVSTLVNGEVYAYKDPEDNWFYVYLVDGEKTLEPFGTKPIIYRCLRDNLVWIACEDRKLRPLTDFIGRAEIISLLRALKEYVDEKVQDVIDAATEALENSREAKELATEADILARALQYDLVNNYYNKSQTYSKEEVNELIITIQKFSYEVVDHLPEASEETLNKLFLVPMETPTNEPGENDTEDFGEIDDNSWDEGEESNDDPPSVDNYEEYVTIRSLSEEGLFEYSWELIGNTRLDLSGYAKLEDLAFVKGTGTGSAVLVDSENIATGQHATALGNKNKAGGVSSTTQGYNTETGGAYTQNTKTPGSDTSSGSYAHAEGNATIAQGSSSHSEGKKTIALGASSHSEGIETKASGEGSHAEGYRTTASGSYSTASGYQTEAKGLGSSTSGVGTVAENNRESAEGSYNKSNKASETFGNSGNTLKSVGIGTSAEGRKNAIEIMQNGDLYVLGIGGYDGTNPSTATPLSNSIPELYKYQVTQSGKIIKGFGVTYDGTQRPSDFRYPIPENVSDLTNDLGFTTVEEVVAYLDTLNKYNIQVVENLPQASEQTMGTVYMVFVDSGVLGIGKIAEKYITVEDSGSYVWKEYDSSPYADLTNYYTKNEVYTKTEVNNIVQEIKQFTYVVVDQLPTASSETMYKIYLVPKSSGGSQGDYKDEYITVVTDSYYTWEQIGTTEIDLSGYLQKSGGTMTGDLIMSGNAPTIGFLRNGVSYSITLDQNGLEISQGDTKILQLGGNNLIWRGKQVALVDDLGKFPTSAPANPVNGSTYFSEDNIYVYNGTSWINSSGNISWTE